MVWCIGACTCALLSIAFHCFLACLCLLTMCQVSCFEGGQQCLLVAKIDWKVLRSCDTLPVHSTGVGRAHAPWTSQTKWTCCVCFPRSSCLNSSSHCREPRLIVEICQLLQEVETASFLTDPACYRWMNSTVFLQLSPWSQSEVIDLNEATSSRWHQEDHRVGLGLPPRAGAGLKNPSSRIGKREVNDSLVATCASLNSKECLQELRKI